MVQNPAHDEEANKEVCGRRNQEDVQHEAEDVANAVRQPALLLQLLSSEVVVGVETILDQVANQNERVEHADQHDYSRCVLVVTPVLNCVDHLPLNGLS